MNRYDNRLHILTKEYDELISRENEKILPGNGVFERYKYPILTADHPPLEWRYDFNPETNPYLMERFGINAVFNAGAIKFNGKYLVMARVEGHDRKSFFAIAESPNGIDNFRFWEYPVLISGRNERLRYASDKTRGRMDIRYLLLGKQRFGRTRRRPHFGHRSSRNHTQQGP